MNRATVIPLFVLMVDLLSNSPAAGQPLQLPVQQTRFDRSTSRDAAESVRFGRRAARVGDEVDQSISLEMRLATSLRQGNQLVERSNATALTSQRRLVNTTEVDAGRAMAVLVRYLEATKTINAANSTPATDATEQAGDSNDSSQPTPQPVEGKSYRCHRESDDTGKLIVTDAEGNIPPMDEYEIVAQNMEMVGRANPLMQFLAGRSFAIGETVELPKDLADRLFNLGDRFGEVTRFDLTLQRVQKVEGAPCAVFLASVEAASNDTSQMRLQVEGPLVVEIDTCRAVKVALSGPIGMSETRGSYSTICQLIGIGQLKMSIASAYRDAKR